MPTLSSPDSFDIRRLIERLLTEFLCSGVGRSETTSLFFPKLPPLLLVRVLSRSSVGDFAGLLSVFLRERLALFMRLSDVAALFSRK